MLEITNQDICLVEEVGVAKMEIFIQQTYQNGTGEHLGNNANGSAAKLGASLKNVHIALSNNVLEL